MYDGKDHWWGGGGQSERYMYLMTDIFVRSVVCASFHKKKIELMSPYVKDKFVDVS